MAFSISLAGYGSSGTSSSTLTSIAFSADVGDLVLVFVSAENAGTNGASSISSVSDSSGNTYVQKALLNRDPGSANAGTTLGVYSSVITSALSSDTVTVNFSPNTRYKCVIIYVLSPSTGKTPAFRFVDTGATGAADNPTYTSSSATSGDVVFGAMCHETGFSYSGDTDTSNGSWTHDTYIYSGYYDGSNYQQALAVQYKVTTGSGTQTWGPVKSGTVTNNDYAIITLAVYEADSEPTYSLAGEGGTYAVSEGEQTGLSYGRVFAANSGSHAITGTSATFVYAKTVFNDGGSYGITGSSATLSEGGAPTGYTFSVTEGIYTVSGVDATFKYNYEITAENAAYSINGAIAQLTKGRTVSVDAGSYSVSGTANSFLWGRIFTVDGGSYSVSSPDAYFLRGYTVVGATAAYTITGGDVIFGAGQRRMAVDAGAYLVEGTNAGLYPAPSPDVVLIGPDPRISFWSSPDGLVQSYPYGYSFAKYVRRSYNVNGNGNIFISTDAGSGLFDARGHLRVTIVDGSTYTGIYAADGSVNAIVINVDDEDPDQLFHSSGALRIAQATLDTPGLISPLNGAMLVANIP